MATAPELPCHAAATSFDAAQAVVRANCAPLGIEWVALAKAGRRILAADAVARIDSPRRDSAAMDGFAVRSQDLTSDFTRLVLRAESVAGGAVPPALLADTAIRVSTGAPMPAGADRVVMHEHARVEGGHIIVPHVSGKPHVRPRASDFAQGTALLPAGTRIDPRAMVVAAAADIEKLPVWRQPRLRVLVNGDELVPPGCAVQDCDTIPDSLSEALLLMARQWGAKPLGALRVMDRVDELRATARMALEDTDVIVIAGGASDGHRDLVRAALTPLGLRMRFAGVAMKPGKPVWYGMIGGIHVLGLPGNPTAALTTARLFLAPMICALSGAGFDHALRWSERRLLHDVPAGSDRDQFLCAVADRTSDGVIIIARQEASAQMMLARADLLVERRAGADPAAAGASVRCLPF
ncbi:molybdopterin molybdotransferase MoeA [Novosphingobium guangzhouense]|uniref:Molybdopterin molybdenumtransferase n=1 Tax=Novosphingobium guangzhouense TaxID=1850347 RepID=A0A2K2G396_9SPHN|nr:molybdopterin molybdotransferase MoeA [Novosphingobium guangzhouense]PNU05509.1 molybdopterin molybdenumtransferase MoeA [Novosphingobium guangzhouense]